jgi:hypothetical protein
VSRLLPNLRELAACPTDVKEVVTLLVKSQWPISNAKGKPRQNIVYVSAERSRPCWTNVTHWIYTGWLSRFEGQLLCPMCLWGLVKLMFPKHGRVHSALE